MERRTSRHFHALYLLALLLLFNGIAAGADNPVLAPPPWSVGDWWVVDCQVYNEGRISPSEPGWTARQSWRFRVENIDSLAGRPHFIVFIQPEQGNSCPYRFRVWFDASSRYVSRYELHHPEPTATKPRRGGPSVVEHDFSDAEPAPLLTGIFPALPLTVPLFDVRQESVSFPAGNTEFDIHQSMEAVDAATALENADPNITGRIDASASNSNRLVRLTTPSDLVELQYWNANLPWCTYGERIIRGQVMRRYWLVETGKN